MTSTRALAASIPIYICAALVCVGQAPALESAFEARDCFALATALKSSDRSDLDVLFYQGVVSNMFHRNDESNRLLLRFVRTASPDNTLLPEALEFEALNYRQLFKYAAASRVLRRLVEKYGARLPVADVNDDKNSATLTEIMTGVGPQRVIGGRNTLVKPNASNHTAGWKLPVRANGHVEELGVDTGANLSLVARSVAKKLGIRMLAGRIQLGSVNSLVVTPEIGVLPRMKIGDLVVENAVFVVMDDKSLTFPDGFFLRGVIGFPVLSGIGRIILRRDGSSVLRPSRASHDPTPICVNDSNILFQAKYRGSPLIFQLDTGAEHSDLYRPFFERFEDEVKQNYKTRTVKITGVGGSEEVPAYMVKDFELNIGSANGTFTEIRLFTTVFGETSRLFYGNIGDDFIKQFSEMVLDLQHMTVEFR